LGIYTHVAYRVALLVAAALLLNAAFEEPPQLLDDMTAGALSLHLLVSAAAGPAAPAACSTLRSTPTSQYIAAAAPCLTVLFLPLLDLLPYCLQHPESTQTLQLLHFVSLNCPAAACPAAPAPAPNLTMCMRDYAVPR
jgi:hypothetical protein